MSDLTAKANELLRRLNKEVFNDSIDISKLPYAVGRVIDFAQDYAADIHMVSKVSKQFLYAPGRCCGDAHQLLESHRAHMQLLGMEEVRKEDESFVEITLHNRRAEQAEAEVERLSKEGERVDADADKWMSRAAKAEAQLSESQQTNRDLNRRCQALQHTINIGAERKAWYGYWVAAASCFDRAQRKVEQLREVMQAVIDKLDDWGMGGELWVNAKAVMENTK